MSELPHVRPEAPAEPVAAGTRPPLNVLDLLQFLCALFVVVTLVIWGFTAWTLPWNLVLGIGAPVIALVVWGLFVSPRAVIPTHPFVRALVELLLYATATIVWWSGGQAWIGLAFAVIAVVVGLVAGRRRLA